MPGDELAHPGNGLRVAHVIHSLGAGGAEALLIDMAPALREAGVECVVIGLSDAEDDRTVHRLEAVGVTVYQLHARRYDLRAILRLQRILEDECIAVVHTHLKHADIVGGIAGRRLGLPVVSTLHTIAGGSASKVEAGKTRVAALSRQRIMARTIAISTAQYQWYARYVGRQGVVLLANGVADIEPSRKREEIRAELGVPPQGLLALTVSLMRPEKGYDVLLDAIRRLAGGPETVFAFCGDGPLLEEVCASVAADSRLTEVVRVLGYREDVSDILSAADLVVHPSREDALPTALISALAAGRPIVASQVGGIPDIVSPEVGLMVAPGDASALAAAIRQVASDPQTRLKWGAAARSRYEELFSASGWVQRLRRVYDEVREGTAHDSGALRPRNVKSVAIVSATTPFPVDNGKCVVMAGFLRYLTDRAPGRVHYLHIGEPSEAGIPIPGVELHEIGRPSRQDLTRALIVDGLVRRRSLQETFTAAATLRARVTAKLDQIKPDLLIVDTIRMAQHVSDYEGSASRILYYDDLFSLRYRRMRAVLSADPVRDIDLLGNFATFIPKRARFLTQLPSTRDVLLKVEEQRVAAAEIRLARWFDTSVILNPAESDHLSIASGVEVQCIPPSVHIRDRGIVPWDGGRNFAYVGLLHVPHNHDGLLWFLKQGLPELIRLVPDARLLVIGSGASDSMRHLMDTLGPHVDALGYVEDLDKLFERSAALVNPLRFGSGIKIKNLEALARGVPVVTTTVGAEGIVPACHPGLRICDTPAQISSELALLTDPVERSSAAAQARLLYEESFAPSVVEARYDEVFGFKTPSSSHSRFRG